MLKTEIRYQKGVGPKIAQTLARLGIATLEDVMYYFPREYEDRRDPVPLAKLEFAKDSFVRARIVKLTLGRTRRNFAIVKGLIKDDSATIPVIWFNQPFLVRALKPGTEVFLSGKLDRDPYSKEILFIPRAYETVTPQNANDPVVPIYGLTEGMSQKIMRKIVKAVLESHLEEVKDLLPEFIRRRYDLPELKSSILALHFPTDVSLLERARHRLAFDELLVFMAGILRNRKLVEKEKGISFSTDGELAGKFLQNLPFPFTGAQERVIGEIKKDMGDDHVMNRLLQGDVGSGKTIVALYAMVIAVMNGYQAAIMAPTEILASQHFRKISALAGDLGIEVLLLTDPRRAAEKRYWKSLRAAAR